MAADAGLQCFLGAASRTGILGQIGCRDPTIDSFRTRIQQKIVELTTNRTLPDSVIRKGTSFAYCGCIVLQTLIVEKLNAFDITKIEGFDETKRQNRLTYFTSDDFLVNFMEKLPFRESIRTTAAQSSYTEWFNTLFNVAYEDWREENLSRVDNQSQCKRAMGLEPSTVIAFLQEKGNIECYLCGRGILPSATGQSTMECEHILPILTALSHWWLIKGPEGDYTHDELRHLELEYDWSHRCCNQLKSNYDVVIYNKQTMRYETNTPIIQNILRMIREGGKYDCDVIKGDVANDQYINIARRVQPIVDEINKNVQEFDDISEYIVLTKYKILSALTDKSFLEALLGNGELVPIKKSKGQIMKERKAEEERLRLEAILEHKRIVAAAKEARAARVEKRKWWNLFGGGQKRPYESPSQNTVASEAEQEEEEEEENYEDIRISEDQIHVKEEWEFPAEFLEMYGGIENLPNVLLDDRFLPTVDQLVLKFNALTEKKVGGARRTRTRKHRTRRMNLYKKRRTRRGRY